MTGPMFVRFDVSVVKRTRMTSRLTLELRGEALNAVLSHSLTTSFDIA